MNKKTIMTVLLISIFLTLPTAVLLVNLVNANNPKTIIVPDDYPTIQIAVVHASSGDTIYVRKGSYEGGILLNKPLSLRGEDALSTIIVGGATLSELTNSSVLSQASEPTASSMLKLSLSSTHKAAQNTENQRASVPIQPANMIPPMTFAVYINSSDIVVSGFTIMGGTRGTYGNGDRLQIYQNILGSVVVGGSNITVANNSRVSLQIGGINNLIVGNTGYLALVSSNSTVIENSLNGFLIQDANSNVIANNTISGANEGIQVGYSGKTSSYNLFAGNKIENAGIWGIILVDGVYNVFYGNIVKNTGIGIGHDGYALALGGTHTSAANNLFLRNSFVNNSKNFGANWQVNGKNIFDNGQEGNYWDDYSTKYPAVSEVDQSGTWNTPYVLIGENIDNHPLLNQPNVTGVVSALPEPWLSLLPMQNYTFTPLPSPIIQTTPSPTTTVSPSASPIQTTSPSPSSTLKPTLSPTLEPTLEPTLTPTPPSNNNQTLDLTPILILSGIVVAAVAVGALIYFKRRK